MRKNNRFLLKFNNQSAESLKFLYKEKFLKEIGEVYELFNNTRVIEVFFLDNHKEAAKLLGHVNIEKWIKGFTIDDTIYILKYTKKFYLSINEFYNVCLHEIVHALFYRKIHYDYPLWINEGLALILSNQYKSINYKIFLNFNSDLYVYEDYYYEKCCAKMIKYISRYGKK